VATAQNGRPYMEDFVHVEQPFAGRDDSLYAGVFDGHGGAAVARRAAKEMHGLVAAGIVRELPTGIAIATAFRAFDDSVAAEASGSVAAVLVLQGPHLTVGNAGDSHVLLVSRTESAILTNDHRLTNEAELRRVVAAGAEISGPYACIPGGGGLMCTRSLGDREFRRIGIIAEPEVTSRTLTEEDVWILSGSDGVWDGLEPELVARIARTATAAKDAAERIRDAAVENNRDNVSVVAVRWA